MDDGQYALFVNGLCKLDAVRLLRQPPLRHFGSNDHRDKNDSFDGLASARLFAFCSRDLRSGCPLVSPTSWTDSEADGV